MPRHNWILFSTLKKACPYFLLRFLKMPHLTLDLVDKDGRFHQFAPKGFNHKRNSNSILEFYQTKQFRNQVDLDQTDLDHPKLNQMDLNQVDLNQLNLNQLNVNHSDRSEFFHYFHYFHIRLVMNLITDLITDFIIDLITDSITNRLLLFNLLFNQVQM